jgi:hypothetical protein
VFFLLFLNYFQFLKECSKIGDRLGGDMAFFKIKYQFCSINIVF